jgi:hypothetical protein
MTGVIDAVAALPETVSPTVQDIGGEQAIYDQQAEILQDHALPMVVAALCDSWPELKSRDLAVHFLLDAAASDNLFVYADVLDLVLNCAEALPDVAKPLSDRIRVASSRGGVGAEIALEAWTRLALGGWCGHIQVRGALAGHIDALPSADPDPSAYLTRAVSAALEQWNDEELLHSLETLANLDPSESDAALELGLYSLGKAAGAEDITGATTSLDRAIMWLERSRQEDKRNDAEVFLLAARALREFSGGRAVAQSEVDDLEAAVFAYLDGFTGLEPHWRAPRSETAPAWLKLIAGLEQATRIAEPVWWEPAAVIDVAAELYSAHASLRLVVNWENTGQPETASPGDRQSGVAAIVRPPIEMGIAGQANAIALLDIWLGKRHEMTPGQPADDLLAAVREMRDHLAEESPPNPKALSGVDPLPDPLRDALHLGGPAAAVLSSAIEKVPALLEVVQEMAAAAPAVSYAEAQVVERVCADVAAIIGTAHGVEPEVRSLVLPLVRFTSYYLDQLQSGSRKTAWLGLSEKPYPPESVLADALDQHLRLSGLTSYTEVPNVGGGRVDVIVQFGRCRFSVEVKRELVARSNAALVTKYGAQAVQYASTDVPIAFMAVMDYGARATRIDLPGAIWTTPFQIDDASRVYALTSVRVQANVASPSTSSRSRKGKGPALPRGS